MELFIEAGLPEGVVNIVNGAHDAVNRILEHPGIEAVSFVGSVLNFDRYAKFGDVDDAAVLMTMTDGLPVLITGTRHNPRGHDFRLEVFGSGDSLSVGQNSASQPRPVEPGEATPDKGPYRGLYGEVRRKPEARDHGLY